MTTVKFDTELYSSFAPTTKDTCTSLKPNCNGQTTLYTQTNPILGYSSIDTFTNGVPIFSSFDSVKMVTCVATSPFCGTVPLPATGTFISSLSRNICYQVKGDSSIFYIQADGVPCYVPSRTIEGDLCGDPIVLNETKTLKEITDNVTFEKLTVCTGKEKDVEYLGNIAPKTFTGSNPIHTSISTTIPTSVCASITPNCGNQAGFTQDKIIGYASTTKASKAIDTTPVPPVNPVNPVTPTTSEPFYKKWWFWLLIGGGVLLIIIIIIIIVVMSKKGKGKGNDSNDAAMNQMMLMAMK